MSGLDEDKINRERALEPQSYIVEAPAGAGKTELLTQRFLMLLARVDEPEAVVAMTFTNKAAAEMRARIWRSLLWAQHQQDATALAPHQAKTLALAQAALAHAHTRNWQLLQAPSRLRVLTMDSFVAHLVRQMPLASGGALNTTEHAQALYREAAEHTIALLDDVSYGQVVADTLGYFRNDMRRCLDLLVGMLAKRDQWLSHTTNLLTPEHINATLRQVLQNEVNITLTHIPASLQHDLMPIARFVADTLPADHALRALQDWQTPLQVTFSDLPRWQALAHLLLTQSGTARKRLGKNEGFGGDDTMTKTHKDKLQALLDVLSEAACAALHQTRRLPSALDAEDVAWVATFSKCLQLAVAQLGLVFQQRGEVDFVEVALRALQALGDADAPSDVALRLDYQISHLLVDEFQDTSQSQLTLLRALVRGWQAHDGRTLFVVGDPMQSVYRFRKAEVSLFAQVQQQGIGDVSLQTLRLSLNNRADAKLVAWINQSFALAFANSPVHYQPFQTAKPSADSAGVYLHAVLSTADSSATFLAEQEATQALTLIKSALVQDNADVAVLVRKRRHLLDLVKLLRRAGVRFQALNVEALCERQAVQDMLSLTHALHHLADRLHWLAILRAPWCGLTLADLYTLAGDDTQRTLWALMHDTTRVTSLSADGQQRLGFLREVLTAAFAQQGRQRRSRWLQETWLRLGAAHTLWSSSDVVDVQALLSCVDDLDARGQFSMPALETAASQLYAAPDNHADAQKLKLMTVHGAKGLEFDTVLVLGLGAFGNSNARESPLLVWEPVPPSGLLAAPYLPSRYRQQSAPNVYDYLSQREQARQQDEAIRVLYVACTRAKRVLHLFASARLSKSGDEVNRATGSALKTLWPSFEAAFAQATPLLSSPEVSTDVPPFTPKLRRLPVEYLSIPVTQRATSQPPSQVSSDDIADTKRQLAIDIGILCHRYLELMVREGAQAWSSARLQTCLPNMQHWLVMHGHLPDAAQQVITLLTRTLESKDGQWLLQPKRNDAFELAVCLREAGQLCYRRIDRTFIESDERWIIDYKTHAPPPNIDLAIWAMQFAPQLDSYAQVFADEAYPLRRAVFLLEKACLLML